MSRSQRWVWAGVAALGMLAAAVAAGWLSPVDRELTAWVALMRAPAMDRLMRIVTFFGSSVWTAAALAGIGLWACRRNGVPAALVVAGAFLVGMGIEVALRLIVPHWRPDVAVIPPSMDVLTRFELAGFPSGHGFRSAFVFGYLARRWHGVHRHWGARAAFCSLLVIALVGISRVYLGRHWPSDVLGSWLVACIALSLVRVWDRTTS